EEEIEGEEEGGMGKSRKRPRMLPESTMCSEKAADPEDVRADGGRTLHVDNLFYYEHQAKGVLLDIFHPLFPEDSRDALASKLFGEIVAHAVGRHNRQSMITSFFRAPEKGE
ncbi:MAG: hypothetical protein ABEI52_11135, partial [Halobacteriaceae archaeon]